MTTIYKVHRWDAILPNYVKEPMPMIYLKPTMELLTHAIERANTIIVTPKNTNSIYDDKEIVGMLDFLVLGPNANLKEFLNREYCTITLNSFFYEYPKTMGEIEIKGMKPKKIEIPDKKIITKETFSPPPPLQNVNITPGANGKLTLLLLAILILGTVIGYLLYKKCK